MNLKRLNALTKFIFNVVTTEIINVIQIIIFLEQFIG